MSLGSLCTCTAISVSLHNHQWSTECFCAADLEVGGGGCEDELLSGVMAWCLVQWIASLWARFGALDEHLFFPLE